MTKDLTQGSPSKLILGFAGPLLIGMLFQQLYSMADAIIVGEYLGKLSFSAVGSTGSLNFLIVGFGIGICSGFAIPVANKFGAKDFYGLRKTVANIAILSIIISIALAVITVIFCKPILQLMRTPDNIFADAYTYIVIIFAGIPAIFLYNTTSGIIRSIGDSKTPVYFLLLASVLNVGLDLLFIVVFKMGVEGAAIATVVAQLISGLCCLYYMYRKYEILRIEKELWKLDGQTTQNLLGIGIPMGLQYTITALGCVILQASVNDLGSDAVASITAGSKISMFLVCPFDALGATMATYGGQNVGAKKLERLTPGMMTAIFSGFIYSIIAFGIVFVFGEKLVLLFLDQTDTATISNAQLYLLINAIFYVLLVLVNVIRFFIQGMGFGAFAIWAGVLEMIARILGAFLLVPMFGYVGACLGNAVAWLFADLFLVPAYIYARKKLAKMFATS